jgi:hypothetical protein
MGVGTSLEVSWCSADGLDSGVVRSVPCADGPAFIAGLSATPAESCLVVVLFSVFVVVCFSSMAFTLHLFCGGGYCRCVSLNIFSTSISWVSFALRRCNFRFCDRVNPGGRHWGHGVFWIDCFVDSRIFFFVCVGRFTKNHQPFVIFLYDDICCYYFDEVSFCRPVGGCSYMPPTGLVGIWGRLVRQSCWACAC